jgi:hypothetical protein
MLRKQTRRSFTVETKGGANQGRAIITAKAPRVPRKTVKSAPVAPQVAFPWELPATAPAETARDSEPRRILPSLITWEPSEPEPVPALPTEPPLPHVRRVAPSVSLEAPRRRGRPRKVVPEPMDVAPSIPEAAPPTPQLAPASPSQARPMRGDRSEAAGLARGERWKRRLPRACW